MKYKHQVRTTQVYQDKEIEAKIDISDEEVETIKATVTGYKSPKEKTVGRERNVPETSLLQILEEGDEELFDKFWWDTIYPRVFIKMLVNGIENGHIEKYSEDDFDYDNEDDFDDIQDMYNDDIDLEHSNCCICKIPEEW